MNVGLLVTQQARQAIGDETLKSFFEVNQELVYVAEIGEHIYQDLRDNGVRGLVIVGDVNSDLIYEIESRTGIVPLAIDVIPTSWVTGKSGRFVKALVSAYLSKASLSMLAYRVQPVRAKSISRRSLLRARLYEYVPYPVLAEQFNVQKEMETLMNSCPKGLIVNTPEGPQVGKVEECEACGYCSGSSYLGYLENPAFSTYQFVSFVNSIVRNYGPAKLLFSCERVNIREGVFPVVLPSIGYLHDSFVLSAYAAGLVPIIYFSNGCRNSSLALKRLEEIPDHFPGTKLPIYKARNEKELEEALSAPVNLKAREIPENLPFSRSRRRSLLVWAIRAMMEEPGVNLEDVVPRGFYVQIDPQKCVLCGVCVRSCQMLVPQMLNQNDTLILEYDFTNCIGSGRCVRSCPEKALTLVEGIKLKDFHKVILNQAKVQRCRFCGKPIGSARVKDRVDELLKSMGFGTNYVDVCNDCKQKVLTKMWLERLGKLGIRK